MNKLIAKVQAYFLSEDGATAIEYGLIAAGIALAIVVIVFTLGDNVENTFTTISDDIAAANTEAGG